MTGQDVESTVEEFVQLEDELTTGEGVAGVYDEGDVVDATKLPASEVPDEYPVHITTEHGLKLLVDTEGGTVPVFVEWPEPSQAHSDIEQLLEALGRDPTEFAGIYGDRVALSAENGWHLIDIQRTATLHEDEGAGTGTPLDDLGLGERLDLSWVTYLAVAASVALAMVPFPIITAFDPDGVAGALVLLVIVGTWLAIPATIFLDSVQRRKKYEPDSDGLTDSSGPLWAGFGIVPVFNIVIGMGYLTYRLGEAFSTGKEISDSWMFVVAASIVALFAWIPAAGLNPALGLLVLTFGIVFLPVAIYRDADHLDSATDLSINPVKWAFGTFCAHFLMISAFVGIAYVLARMNKVG